MRNKIPLSTASTESPSLDIPTKFPHNHSSRYHWVIPYEETSIRSMSYRTIDVTYGRSNWRELTFTALFAKPFLGRKDRSATMRCHVPVTGRLRDTGQRGAYFSLILQPQRRHSSACISLKMLIVYHFGHLKHEQLSNPPIYAT